MYGGGAQPTEGSTEVDVNVQGVGKGGCGCPDLGNNLRSGVTGGTSAWFGEVGDDTAHLECVGNIPPQGGPQADGTATSQEEGWEVGLYPAGGSDGGDGVTGGGDLRIPPTYHSSTVHCDQAHCGPVSDGREASGVTGVQEVVGE